MNWVERSGRYGLWNETHSEMHTPCSPWDLLEEKVLALALLRPAPLLSFLKSSKAVKSFTSSEGEEEGSASTASS